MRYPALNATGQTVISRMGQVYSFTRQALRRRRAATQVTRTKTGGVSGVNRWVPAYTRYMPGRFSRQPVPVPAITRHPGGCL